MKAFIYQRRDSKKIEEIQQVETMHVDRFSRTVHFIDEEGIEYVYSMKEVKSTCFQN